MKTATQAMKDYLAANKSFLVADLYTFTLLSGLVLRYTPFDMSLTIGGTTWLTGGPIINRDHIRSAVGIEVKEMKLSIAPRATDLVNGVDWLKAAKRGAFNGCVVLLERTVMPTAGDASTLGKYWKFSGEMGPVVLDRQVMDVTVYSGEKVFNRIFPIHEIQPGCRHTLYDAGCTLAKSSFKSSTTATAGSTQAVLNCGLAQAAGYFTLGTITFTGGPNTGVSRTVKAYTPGVITLARPLPSVPGVGDAFDAYAGCDKLQATCTTKFSNLPNFSAEPYVPAPETAA